MLYNVWAGGEKLNANSMNLEHAEKMAFLWNTQKYGIEVAKDIRRAIGWAKNNRYAKVIKQWTI